jgi:hypothetical protein
VGNCSPTVGPDLFVQGVSPFQLRPALRSPKCFGETVRRTSHASSAYNLQDRDLLPDGHVPCVHVEKDLIARTAYLQGRQERVLAKTANRNLLAFAVG